MKDQKEHRSRLGLSINLDNQTWVDNFVEPIEHLAERIEVLEDDVEVLKQECIDRGLVGEDGEPIAYPDPLEEYTKFPLLIPNPAHKMEPPPNLFPDKNTDGTDFTKGNIDN